MWPGSKVWDYTYDACNRLSRVDIPNGMHTEYSYDSSGPQDSIRHKNGSTVKQCFDYTFDDGDNMLTKSVPWYDDFEDGNITGWSGGTSYFSVVGGVLKNTLDASFAREIYLSETDADQDLRFDYVRYSSTGTALVQLRYTGGNDRLWLEIQPTQLLLRQVDGGTLTNLATYSTTVSQNARYSARVELDGGSVKVWWGTQGGDFNQVISATTTELTTSRAAMLRANANTEHGWDNVQLIAGTRSTVETFTYNDANEQITQTKNGVTTDMTYDEWGRMVERDDGTHTATYGYRYGSKLYSFTSDFPGEGNVTYETGGDGKRRSRVAGLDETWYNYTIGFDIISTEDDADGSTGNLTMTNVVRSPTAQVSAALADLAGTTPASGTARYYTTDHLGSTRGAWNASKVAVGAYEFDPYGGEYTHTGVALGTLAGAYTGKPWDATAKLFHFPYRQYSPDMARWTSRDPLGMVDGTNVYMFCLSSPIVKVDPQGLASLPGLLCAVACGGGAAGAVLLCGGEAAPPLWPAIIAGGIGAGLCYLFCDQFEPKPSGPGTGPGPGPGPGPGTGPPPCNSLGPGRVVARDGNGNCTSYVPGAPYSGKKCTCD